MKKTMKWFVVLTASILMLTSTAMMVNAGKEQSTFLDTAGIKTVSVDFTSKMTLLETMDNPLPEIVDLSNNKTDNDTKILKINVSEPINFNVSADQPITTWTWYKDGTYQDIEFDNFSTSWNTPGIKNVSVNATNDNGTSETIIWDITINPLPEIVDWSNTKTDNDTKILTIFIDQQITFNASADQLITTWNWYKEGIKQINNSDNFTTSWPIVGIRTIEVNATNENGTSNTVNWEITVKSGKGRPPEKGRDQDGIDLGVLYGDLYIILRDDNGVPIPDSNGCVIAINKSDGTNITLVYDEEHETCELPPGAEEWVTEVHFGRLAVARAPSAVIEASYDEAIRVINSATKIRLEPSGRFLLTLEAEDEDEEIFEYDKAIDASLENLGLYKKIMLDGHLEGNLGDYDYLDGGDPVAPPRKRPTLDVAHFEAAVLAGDPSLDLSHLLVDHGADEVGNKDFISAASFLAAAADKFGYLHVDLVVNLNTVLRLNADQDGDDKLEPDEYVDFSIMNYDREAHYTQDYSKSITVLQSATCQGNNYWEETELTLIENGYGNETVFSRDEGNPFVPDSNWIAGFVQAGDDSLRIIDFVHTYQIPEER
ncbi:MAG: hypothetical protein MIO93_06455 [ANME-2 cluster archaeon]|nr:hypothetical protein [ANME-2 cluster archaeon]